MKSFKTVIDQTALILPPPWATLSAPLGICTIGQIFRKNKIECHIFDWNTELLYELKLKYGQSFNKEFPLFWDDIYSSAEWKDPYILKKPIGKIINSWIEQHVVSLINDGYKTFGLSIFITNIIIASHIIQLIRTYLPESFIFVGGPATYDIIEYGKNKNLLSNADYIFYTESEQSLSLLLESINNHKDKVHVPGTAFYETDGSLIFTPHSVKPDLNLIPPINFDDLNLNLYSGKGIPIEYSRGCSGTCNFCSETWRYKPYRTRPISNIIHDFDLVGNKYKADKVSLICSTLNGNKDHLASFCNALISKKNKIKWNGNAHIDKYLDVKLLKLMAQSGCERLIFGLESASNHVLKIMNKQSNKQIASQIIEICSDIGITLTINLVVGFPGETEEDLEETVDFIGKYHKKINYFSVHKCCVDNHAILGRYPKRFGIMTDKNLIVSVDPKQPPGHEPLQIIPNGFPWEDWCTTDFSNTPYIRNKRLQTVIDCLNKLNKPKNAPQDSKKSDNIITGI